MALRGRSTLARNGYGHVSGRFHYYARRQFALSCFKAQERLPQNPNNIRNNASAGPPNSDSHWDRAQRVPPAKPWGLAEDISSGNQQPVSSEKHFFNPDLRQKMADAGFEKPVRIRTHEVPDKRSFEVAGTRTATTSSRRRKKNIQYSDVADIASNGNVATSNIRTSNSAEENSATVPDQIGIFLDGQPAYYSPILLRDMCTCPSCLDPSTKQKLFTTADIPADIKTRAVAQDSSSISLLWENDIPGYDEEHATVLDISALRSLRDSGASPSAATGFQPDEQTIWDAQQYRQLQDFDYDEYMQDDATLFRALQQLHVHGMLFLTNVPGDEKSVSTIGERIGPIKNTFYGSTWDVRSVPEAKNVAYTSQDLGFHMDLMYLHQPPHLQLLHCIRSSAAGGASVFADSYKAAADLFAEDIEAFVRLAQFPIPFHYDHPESHLYHQERNVIETEGLTFGTQTIRALVRASRENEHRSASDPQPKAVQLFRSLQSRERKIEHFIKNVSWSPPFQAPIQMPDMPDWKVESDRRSELPLLGKRLMEWHRAAQKFNKLLHREAGMYERMMRPGECVIFDNRRVVHARKAFESGDAGKERWLRGTYVDWDPYWSKMRVLGRRFGKTNVSQETSSSTSQ